jgi:hypothetical protein
MNSMPLSPYAPKNLNEHLVDNDKKIPEEIALELAELAKEYPYFRIGYHAGDNVWYAMLEDHLIWVNKNMWQKTTKNEFNRYTALLNKWR